MDTEKKILVISLEKWRDLYNNCIGQNYPIDIITFEAIDSVTIGDYQTIVLGYAADQTIPKLREIGYDGPIVVVCNSEEFYKEFDITLESERASFDDNTIPAEIDAHSFATFPRNLNKAIEKALSA
ncbi:MAG: hypothetical protein ABIF08_01695 [Nanoarchaeota archaeon]